MKISESGVSGGVSTESSPEAQNGRGNAKAGRDRSGAGGDPRGRPRKKFILELLIEAQRAPAQDSEAKARLDELISELQESHGEIKLAHFCQNIAGAVILTQEQATPRPAKRRWPRRLRGGEETGDMHILMHYPRKSVVSVSPDFEEALWRCSALSIKANQLLRTKNSQMIHLQMHSLLVYLLSVLDTLSVMTEQEERAPRISKALSRANAELDAAEEVYSSCAAWGAQVAYSKGMLYGITSLFVLEGLLASLLMLQTVSRLPALDRFFIGLGAGGLGAIVSVMQRMSSENLRLNLLAEHKSLMLIGMFRPLIGGLFGAAFVVLVAAGLLNIPEPVTSQGPLYFLASLAFLAGFSERFAQVTLSGVSKNDLRSSASENESPKGDRVAPPQGIKPGV